MWKQSIVERTHKNKIELSPSNQPFGDFEKNKIISYKCICFFGMIMILDSWIHTSLKMKFRWHALLFCIVDFFFPMIFKYITCNSFTKQCKTLTTETNWWLVIEYDISQSFLIFFWMVYKPVRFPCKTIDLDKL